MDDIERDISPTMSELADPADPPLPGMTRCRFRADVDAPYEAIGRYQDLPMIQKALGTVALFGTIDKGTPRAV